VPAPILVEDGASHLGAHDDQVNFESAMMSADEAAHADLCRYIDATVLGDGTLPQRINWRCGKLTR
jgi:hypothetical protein